MPDVVTPHTRSPVRRWGARLAWIVAGALVAAVALYVEQFGSLPDLEIWHRIDFEHELDARAADEITDLDDYLALEDRLFAELDQVERGLADTFALSRFRPDSPTNPRGFAVNWNRTRWIEPTGEMRGAVLLLHGLTDAPYSLHAVGQNLAGHGFAVLALRLPGHGTMPAGLTRASVGDWRLAVRIAARAVAARTAGRPWAIVGYSNGAALALDHALAAIAGDESAPPRPDRLVLLSPALAVSEVAALAQWQERVSWVPGLEKLGWSPVLLEYDPYKYNSFPLHAAAELYELTSEVEALLARLEAAGQLADLPPVLTLQSAVDATVPPIPSLERLYGRVHDEGSELVVFDVNRFAVALGILSPWVDELLDAARRAGSFAFDVTLVTNQVGTEAVEARRWAPQASAPAIEPLDLGWPTGVYSLSHVAIPIPPDDPLYGIGARDGLFPLGNLEVRGELGALLVPGDLLMRLRYNPFHAYLDRRVLEFLGGRQAG